MIEVVAAIWVGLSAAAKKRVGGFSLDMAVAAEAGVAIDTCLTASGRCLYGFPTSCSRVGGFVLHCNGAGDSGRRRSAVAAAARISRQVGRAAANAPARRPTVSRRLRALGARPADDGWQCCGQPTDRSTRQGRFGARDDAAARSTPNVHRAGTKDTFDGLAGQRAVVSYVTAAEFERYATELGELSDRLSAFYPPGTVADIRDLAVVQFWERSIIGAPGFRREDAAILGRD